MDKWTSKIEEVAAKFDVQMRVSSQPSVGDSGTDRHCSER